MNDEDRGGDIVVHYDDDYDYFPGLCWANHAKNYAANSDTRFGSTYATHM